MKRLSLVLVVLVFFISCDGENVTPDNGQDGMTEADQYAEFIGDWKVVSVEVNNTIYENVEDIERFCEFEETAPILVDMNIFAENGELEGEWTRRCPSNDEYDEYDVPIVFSENTMTVEAPDNIIFEYDIIEKPKNNTMKLSIESRGDVLISTLSK